MQPETRQAACTLSTRACEDALGPPITTLSMNAHEMAQACEYRLKKRILPHMVSATARASES